MITVSSVLSATGTMTSVVEFIQGTMSSILQEFGQTELDAARMSLKNANWARDPKREVELTVGHLQSAHAAFTRSYSNKSTFQNIYYHQSFRLACYYDIWTNLLMAVCYCYLDEPQLMQQCFDRIKGIRITYQRIEESFAPHTGFIALISPEVYRALIDPEYRKDIPMENVPEDKVDELRSQLSKICGIR